MEYDNAPNNAASAGAQVQVSGVIGRAIPSGSQLGVQQVRKQTQAELVRDNAERAVNRLSSTRSQLEELRTRLCGAMPPSASEARDTLNASGFIHGTGSALERVHIEISEIDAILSALAEVV